MANTSLGLWFSWCEVNGPVYCFRIGPENNQNDEDENNANNDIIINSNNGNDGNNNENENSIHHMDAAQEKENV